MNNSIGEIFELFESNDYDHSLRRSKLEELEEMVALKIENDPEILSQFLTTLQSTSSRANWYLITNALVTFAEKWEANNDLIVDALVATIKKKESENYRGQLTWACSEYDCANYFSFFIDLVINDTYATAWTSTETIYNMSRISYSDIAVQMEKVRTSKLNGQIACDKDKLIEQLEEYFSETVEDE